MSGAATLSILFALTGPANLAAAQSNFVPGFEDLPLMFELGATDSAPIIFDTPSGRIIEAHAAGQSSKSRVMAFYHETLPQLGWRAATAEGTFLREGEILTLTVSEPRSGEVEIRFSLTPAPAAKR